MASKGRQNSGHLPQAVDSGVTLDGRKSGVVPEGKSSVLLTSQGMTSASEVESPEPQDTGKKKKKRSKKDRKFKHHKHSVWYRLRRRYGHAGVTPLEKDHPLYPILTAMSIGLHSIITQDENTAKVWNFSYHVNLPAGTCHSALFPADFCVIYHLS